jgi:ribosome biogenesis GTPase A
VLTSLAEAAELLGVAEVADLAAETAGRLQALRLEVAVAGACKRGKSSLINALVGREVLPVGVLPPHRRPAAVHLSGRRRRMTMDQSARGPAQPP